MKNKLKQIIKDILLEEFIDYNKLNKDIHQISSLNITSKLKDYPTILKQYNITYGHFAIGYIKTSNKKINIIVPIHDKDDLKTYFKYEFNKPHTFDYLEDIHNNNDHYIYITDTIVINDSKIIDDDGDKLNLNKKYELYQIHTSFVTPGSIDYFH